MINNLGSAYCEYVKDDAVINRTGHKISQLKRKSELPGNLSWAEEQLL